MKLKMINGKIYKASKTTETNTKKYKRFLELCSKAVKFNDLQIGFVCYNDFQKFEIISEPYFSTGTKSLVIDCKTTFSEGQEDEFSVPNDFMSLRDINIVGGGYNLSRVFASKEDAIEYRNITKTYEYWQKSRFHGCYGNDEELCYIIKPIPGEKKDLTKLNLETREITRFSRFGKN
jgi:hypothetical protein